LRVSEELKRELERLADEDEDTDSLSEWARRELRAAARIRQAQRHD
jgi:hypothetical protein